MELLRGHRSTGFIPGGGVPHHKGKNKKEGVRQQGLPRGKQSCEHITAYPAWNRTYPNVQRLEREEKKMKGLNWKKGGHVGPLGVKNLILAKEEGKGGKKNILFCLPAIGKKLLCI